MEQLQDQEVLIARNNETGQVGAVVGQNPDGTPQMADARTAKLSDLVKFNKGQNPLEAFMSNFIRQAKNPSLFGFFKLPADRYDAIAPAMADLIQDPVSNGEMLKPYEVDVKSVAQTQSQEQTPVQEPEVNPQPEPDNVQSQPEAAATAIKAAPIDPNKIDWATIEKEWGVTRQQLEQNGDLRQMIYNHKSPNLVRIAPVLDGQRIEADAKLSFKHNPDGSITLSPHFMKSRPNLEQEYRGYTFTEQDKAQLRKTGNLGKAVDLVDPKTGEVQKCIVSLDKLTNEIESQTVDGTYIKPKIANIELTMREIGILKNGGILPKKFVELADGRKFYADLQYSVEKRDVGFNSEPYRKENQELRNKDAQTQAPEGDKQTQGNWLDKDGNIKRLHQWCKIPLDEQKQADYMAGKLVRVGESKDKFGNDCIIYVQFDPQKGQPETTREYPDRSKVVGIAEESKTQLSVNNDGQTNEATKNIREPLRKGQTEPNNETQQKEQKKSKGPRI